MNSNLEKIYLVYVNFAGKPHAQKWFGWKVFSPNKSQYPEGFFACEPRLLTEQDRNLTLRELCAKYPPPEKKKDKTNAN